METDRHDDLEEQRIETVACEAYTLHSSIVYGKQVHVSIEGHILESLRTLHLNVHVVLKAAWNETRSQGPGVDCIGVWPSTNKIRLQYVICVYFVYYSALKAWAMTARD